RARDRLRPPRRHRGVRPVALRHDHADPRRSGHELDLAALVPARPRGADLLRPDADHGRPDQLGIQPLRRARDAPHDQASDEPEDQLPDHRELPRVQGGRRPARRRVDGHRPPLLQQEHRRLVRQLREHQSSARLPEARRRRGARLRALPAHGRRLPPARAPAGVRASVQGAGVAVLRLPEVPGARQRRREQHRGRRGGHKLQGKEVLSYALFAKGLPGGHFFQPRIEGVTGSSVTSAPAGAIQKAIGEFENPDVQQSKAANAAALGTHVKSKAPPPSKVSVLVLNGNGVQGAAANASYLLGQRGYVTLVPPNGLGADAPSDVFHSRIYYDAQKAGAKAAAQAMLPLLQPASVLPLPRSRKLRALDPGAMVVVVLGQTFHGELAPIPTSTAPKHQPPYVRTDPTVATPLLEPYRAKAGFKLMVPTVLERSSYPDSYNGDVPARFYTIQGKNKAVRLVFRTGPGEYWGVEETSWTDAPVLADKSFRHDLGGREFDLYYAGSRLHMVVLKTSTATYWVVNTLLDSLSNETMMAIAKGLRPLTGSK